MGNQDELDTFCSVAIRNHHGKCENQADVVRNKELHNWMLSASLPLDQRIYIMMLSSVVTCPSMTALFHELLKQRTDHILSFASTCAAFCIDLRGVAKSILEKFSERGLSEIAKPEIQAFTMRPGCTPSASNIDKVVDGFWNNHRKIDAFVEQLAAATTGGSIFNEREVYDNLHVTLSTCGGGYGPYQAARFLRLWFFIHGKVDLPGRPTPTTMADGLYDVIPQHLRGLVPTGVTALQYSFEICMRNKSVRNVDPEMVKKLREAYYSQAVRAAAAPRDDLGSDDSDDDVQARGRAAEENTNTHDGDDSDASTVRDHPTKTRDHPKTSNGVPTCAESASTSSDDDDQTNGVARGEGESDETRSSDEDTYNPLAALQQQRKEALAGRKRKQRGPRYFHLRYGGYDCEELFTRCDDGSYVGAFHKESFSNEEALRAFVREKRGNDNTLVEIKSPAEAVRIKCADSGICEPTTTSTTSATTALTAALHTERPL